MRGREGPRLTAKGWIDSIIRPCLEVSVQKLFKDQGMDLHSLFDIMRRRAVDLKLILRYAIITEKG